MGRLGWGLILLLLPACGVKDFPTTQQPSSQPSGRVGVAYGIPMRCQDGTPRSSLPAGYEVISDVVALPTDGTAEHALAVAETGHPDPALRLFAAVDLLVSRRGTSIFEVKVPYWLHDRVAIGWGYEQAPVHSY